MAAREAEDELQKHYNAIAEGAKELRIHRPRRQRMFVSGIKATAEFICNTQVRSINTFVIAKTFGSMLFFVVIGLALALQTFWPSADKTVMSGFVLVLLYMKGPLEHLISTCRSSAARRSPSAASPNCREQFSTPEPHLLLSDQGHVKPAVHSTETGRCALRLPGGGRAAPFQLGPVNLRSSKATSPLSSARTVAARPR